MPKFNMYQSLHTTVIGPQGKPVELQIRTFAMHRRAEYGVAAHWKYKENGKAGVDTDRLGDLDDMTWVRQLLDWQSEVEDPGEFLESLRFEINRAEVYVFTPRGDVIALPIGRDAGRLRLRRAHRGRPPHDRRPGQRPAGAAGVDARQRRRRRGLHLQGAERRARRATGSNFVKSPRARSKIRQWFTKERREEAIERGKDQIAKLMRKEGLPLKRLLSHESLTLAAEHFQPRRRLRALRRRRGGQPQRPGRRTRVIDLHGGDDGAAEDLAEGVTITGRRGRRQARPRRRRRRHRQGRARRWVKLAKCCTPVPARRDPRLRHQGRRACRCTAATAPTPPAARRSPSGCSRSSGRRPRSRRSWCNIQVEALDRARLLSDITMVLSDAHVNILSATPLHHPRPGRQEPLHLRDGRGQAPRHRAPRRPRRPGRLRRLPRHPAELERSLARAAMQARRLGAHGLSARPFTALNAVAPRSRGAAAQCPVRDPRRSLAAAASARESAEARRAISRNGRREARFSSRSLTFFGRRRRRGPCRGRPRPRRWPDSSLATMSSARADFSGSLTAPLLVLDPADGLLDLAHPALELLHPVAGDLAGGVPAVGDVAEGLLGGLEVGDRHQRLGLDEQLPP